MSRRNNGEGERRGDINKLNIMRMKREKEEMERMERQKEEMKRQKEEMERQKEEMERQKEERERMQRQKEERERQKEERIQRQKEERERRKEERERRKEEREREKEEMKILQRGVTFTIGQDGPFDRVAHVEPFVPRRSFPDYLNSEDARNVEPFVPPVRPMTLQDYENSEKPIYLNLKLV
jgi:TolA-binding protein